MSRHTRQDQLAPTRAYFSHNEVRIKHKIFSVLGVTKNTMWCRYELVELGGSATPCKRASEIAWINGSFIVMEPGVPNYLSKDDDVLEIDLPERLTRDGQLAAYQHQGFWQC